MDKAINVGFAILKLSKLHLYETYYDNYDTLQQYFGQEILQLHYIDTHGMILSMKTQSIIKYLKNLEDIVDFGNLDEKHEKFSNKNKKSNNNFITEEYILNPSNTDFKILYEHLRDLIF